MTTHCRRLYRNTTGHYVQLLCVGCEGEQLQVRSMSWKGASQPRTLERAFQAVEIAQEETRRRGRGVPRNRGRLV